jgi:hypothetical protein
MALTVLPLVLQWMAQHSKLWIYDRFHRLNVNRPRSEVTVLALERLCDVTPHQSSSSLECTGYYAFLTGYSPTVSKWAPLDLPSTVYAPMEVTLCTFQLHPLVRLSEV